MLSMLSNGNTLSWEQTSYGELTFIPMTTAPYPHPKRMEGYTQGTTFYSYQDHYSNSSVAIILPKGYKYKPSLDIIVHLHGHMTDLPEVLSIYHLGEQLSSSGKNAILVIPQGPMKVPDSSFGKLDDIDGFKNFMHELLDVLIKDERFGSLNKPHIHSIILTAHSGGYYTVGQILEQGGLTDKIKEVYLLDATYGQQEKYIKWLSQSSGRLISIFTAHLANENVDFMLGLQEAKILYGLVRESRVSDLQLKKFKVLFLPTSLGHIQVPYQTRLIERFLKTSSLTNK